jgi:nucleotide-binding universal stress UspA family protein
MSTAAAIRVVIVDDHAMVAEALAAAVDTQPDVVVTGVAGTLEQGMALIAAEQPDVVVMSTHGRTGFAQLLMGSVAEKVVRRSSVPVLVVDGLTVRLPPGGT